MAISRKSNSIRHGKNVIIYAHHGCGGGQTVGGKINRVRKFATGFDADIYLMGHVHDKYVFTEEQFTMTGTKTPRLIAKRRAFGLTGSFFETYIDGPSSYAEKKGYNPIPTGVIKFIIIPFKSEWVNGKPIDLPIDIHPSV